MGQAYTFGGASIFGRGAVAATEIAERASQINEYFGLDGVEILDGGARGGSTVVHGFIVGSDLAAFNALWSAAAGYQDGGARSLVTSLGTFAGVQLVKWSPTSKLMTVPGGVVLQGYRAAFRHTL